MHNHMELTFSAVAQNEAFARMVISAFLMQANPTLTVISEVRTAVSEAVTNAVVHAYGAQGGNIVLRATLSGSRVDVEVEDFGCGIADIDQAMQPFYTSQPDTERTGMGFVLMQSFMDTLSVHSTAGNGTIVKMSKSLEEQPS